MAAVSLRLGDLVWGKLGRYPPWPGKIVNPPKDLKKPRGKKCFFVKFFGTEDHAWIKVEQLKPYHAHKEEMIKINKGKRFQQAVDAVEEFLRRAKGKDQTSSHSSADDKNRRNSSEERSRPNSGDEKRKLSLSEGKVKKNMGEGKKRVSSGSSERGSKSPLKRAQEQSPRKRGRPPKDEKDLTIPESSTVKGMMAGPMAAFKWQPTVSEPVKDADPHFHHFLLSQTEKPAVCYQAITKKLKICEEETGSTSIQAADSTAVNGSITPTDKKIGFLGLGLMGSGIVSNLLKMGHTVTVWNRTAEKKKEIQGFSGGAVVESLPADAGDTGSCPAPGGSHMPQSGWAREPWPLSLCVQSLCSATGEATTVRGPCTAKKKKRKERKRKYSKMLMMYFVMRCSSDFNFQKRKISACRPPRQKQFSTEWQPVSPSPASPAHRALGRFHHSQDSDSHKERQTSTIHILFFIQKTFSRRLFCASCEVEHGTSS
ncbi:cytokine-like nuclear factor N-PAC isoform X8 [Tursiops truncatus]|uniref:cytokine-like nuclear factor N-PAC isoform X8 n=1 Tax=Tursiops truncatus TaxID=9739 RepID=UPI003CCF4236